MAIGWHQSPTEIRGTRKTAQHPTSRQMTTVQNEIEQKESV